MRSIYLAAAVLLVSTVALTAQAAFGRWFDAELSGANEVPPVSTNTTGRADIKFNRELTVADFDLWVRDGQNITQAHLHCAPAGQNGPIVAFLFGNIPGGFDVDGELADFDLTEANIIQDAGCDPDISTMADLAQATRDGRIYVNVHSVEHPAGLIRGQLHE